MNKNTEIISELKSFLSKDDNSRAVTAIMNTMERIRIDERQMGVEKNPNCKMTCAQTLQLMVLFPFFALKNAGNYVGSVLEKLFGCKRDIFYRFLSHPDIDWRKIVHSINRRLLNRISVRTDARKKESPVCMIVDDTEMEKTGKHSELLGMVKFGKTKYGTRWGAMTAGAIASKLDRIKAVQYSRKHKFYHASIIVKFAGADVRLFFYRNGRRGAWNALLSTDTSLDAFKAYRIYSMRWAIEVCFKEMKGLLNLGKCQCRDFASQIASISLCMMQYNILGYVKRFEAYETIGGLFREVSKQSIQLTVTERIWDIIMSVVNTISEILSTDPVELLRGIINQNREIIAVKRAFDQMQIVA